MSSNNPEVIIHGLLDLRGPDKSICPSEAAKRLAQFDEDWREKMEEIHAALDSMIESGSIELSWKGQPMHRRRGPYRITRRQNTE